MSIFKILKYPDKRLRIIAKSIKKINNDISIIINNMFKTMYFSNGIGLAATQINIHIQLIVIDISENKNKPLVLINPIVLKKSGLIVFEEGCLSIPNQRACIKRYQRIKIQSLDKNGNLFKLKAQDLLSVCIQHEMDHLVGKLFIDYLPKIKYY